MKDENIRHVRVHSITMENWKCFKFKNIRFKGGMNFYNQENGSGKSSIIQAIFYVIYGRLPQGVKIADIKNDKDKDLAISMEFTDIENNRYKIKRSIKGVREAKTSELKRNNEDSEAYSITQINDIMESFFGDKRFIDIIWSQIPLIYSGIFKSEFISNILSDHLKDTREFQKEVKLRNLELKKERRTIEDLLKNFSGNEEDVDKVINDIREEIIRISNKLKDKTKSDVTDNKKSMAERCLRAKIEISAIQDIDRYTKDELSRYKSLKSREKYNKSIIDSFSEESSLKLEKYKNFFNSSEIRKLIKINNMSKKCPVCFSDFIIEISDSDLKSLEIEDKYKEAYALIIELDSYNQSKIEISEKYYSLYSDSAIFENPEEIIEEFNRETDMEWNMLDSLNKKLESYTKGKTYFKDLRKIDEESQYNLKLLEISQNYEKECINFYISSILFKSSDLLSSIDDKYMGMYFDIEAQTYQVVLGEDGSISTRNVELLSGGERTVAALCLMLACKEIFMPSSIMILDESLGSLDSIHLSSCIKILKNEGSQTVVVAHNSDEEPGKKFK